jgi:hypothetical protein
LMQQSTATTEAKLESAQVGQPTSVAGKGNCCHHWVIEFAVGPLSKGECRLCGAERVFRNHLRWAEIAPVRPMTGRRQVDDNSAIDEKRGEGRRPFDSSGAEQMGEIFGYAVAGRR